VSADPRTGGMRLVTLGLGSNLRVIHWAWERPAQVRERASVPMQLVASLLSLVALCPLEEMLYDLAEDSLTTRRITAARTQDFQADNPEGFLAQLPRWRTAVGAGRVEMITTPDGQRLHGLRAWQPPTPDGGEAWSMTLNVERLSTIVHTLSDLLPAWGKEPLRLTLPPQQLD